MDKHGYMRSSLTNMYERHYFDNADKIILEVNPNLPWIEGNSEIHISKVDRLVEVNTPIPTIGQATLTEEDISIGNYIGELINDGDTIQLGIGGIPDAIALALKDKKDLGIHTEMINSGMAKLMKEGVITNERKTFLKGKTVGAFAFGDQELYDNLDRNPSILILDSHFTNDLSIIARNDNMVSINTSLQVDLTGQVCSESIGTRHYSGTGGQTETAIGANLSKNGRSIIALKSTAKAGTISSITPVLSPGAIVTLSRNSVDYVVTEYGVAPMKGRSIRDRVSNLISIAHPNFREELRKE